MARIPLVVVLAGAVSALAATAQQPRPPLEFRQLALWSERPLSESSGVAVSRSHPGILWTHNDSGDGPFVYATDTTGTLIATFEVAGARAVDWEDVALAACPSETWPGRTCLYIADTGDNVGRRRRVPLYAVPEPATIPRDVTSPIPTERARALRLRYPDGPQDAEALAALPDGSLALITKGRSGVLARYSVPPAAWRNQDYDLTTPDTLPILPQILLGRLVTGAATAPDGEHVAVRTYTEVFRFQVGARWALAGPPCRMGLVEAQGEAVDFLDDQWLVLTSERARGVPGGIAILRCAWE